MPAAAMSASYPHGAGGGDLFRRTYDKAARAVAPEVARTVEQKRQSTTLPAGWSTIRSAQ
jgi:hypothetical protein